MAWTWTRSSTRPRRSRSAQGDAGRAKLLYRMKLPMRTLKPKDSGIELRSATSQGKSVQDVLPPTIHPDTKKPYTWVYGDKMLGHWSNPPPIPAQLLALWRSLAAAAPTTNQQATARADVTIDTVRKAMYQKHQARAAWTFPTMTTGSRLACSCTMRTGGAQDGLELWDQWSATDKSFR
jgi:hypothetical protein